MAEARVRVAVYVTRRSGGRTEVLVFDHRDFPEAGTQVPAGGVDPGELLGTAARREVREETGVDDLVMGEALAVQQRPHPTTGQDRVTVFFHARTSERRRDWTHTVASGVGGQDSGLVLHCFFVPVEEAEKLLADAQGEFVPLVPEDR